MRRNQVISIALAVIGLLFFGTQVARGDCPGFPFAQGTIVGTECQVNGAVTATGPFTLPETLHICGSPAAIAPCASLVPGVITTGGLNLDITAGDFLMDGGAEINADVNGGGCPGTGNPITILVELGNVNMAAGPPKSYIHSNSCHGGPIDIRAPKGKVDIDGTVESVGAESGTGATQGTGGGTITIIGGCNLTVTDAGLVSSRGRDPGADLVHLEACTVTIYGIVESTGAGHANPNNPANHCNLEPAAHPPGNDPSNFFTGCVEIWAGTTVTIDSTPFLGPPAGVHHGEINADIGITGGTNGRGWIDIYANGNITIIDGTGNDHAYPNGGCPDFLSTFAVHSNGGRCESTDDGGLITIKSLAGDVVAASGDAIQADALSGGSNGGNIYVEAFNNVTFTANLSAQGDSNPTGGFGDGGKGGIVGVPMRAYHGAFSWTSGSGNVQPTGDGIPDLEDRGVINLQGCTLTTAGATFPSTGNPTTPSTTVACAGAGIGPTKATSGALPLATCLDSCGSPLPPPCPEDPNRARLLTRTVDTSKPAPGPGTGAPGNPINYLKVQDAYNAAKVSGQAEVIGLFSNTTENLTLDGSKSLTITQCTLARVTAVNNSVPVWAITSTGRLLIIGPDSVGGSIGWSVGGGGSHNLKSVRANGASLDGVLITSGGNSVSWNDVSGNGNGTATAAGIRVLGGTNILKGGTVGSNRGDGVQLVGNGNNLSGATIQSNTGHGVLVSGTTNTVDSNTMNLNGTGATGNGILATGGSNILSNNSSDAGKGNKQNGIQVASGTGNQVTNNKMNSNGGAGYNFAASTATKVKSNSTSNNTGNEYTIGSGNTDMTGNKRNGSGFTFTSAGGNFN